MLRKDFILPVQDEDYYDVFHIFNIRHQKRDEIREYLKKNEIITEVHYPVPPHKQKALSFMSGKNFPLSEEIHSTTLSLPISSSHSENEILRVVEVLNNF
jgi:dTDP-4-amino-4,6-dideoxygalactose transaminase